MNFEERMKQRAQEVEAVIRRSLPEETGFQRTAAAPYIGSIRKTNGSRRSSSTR